MSNQQWPSGGNQPNNPWAQQDPNWRPPQFHDAQGRDPRQPFGQPAAAPPPPEQWEPPKQSKKSLWLVLGAVAAIAALVIGLQLFSSSSPEAQSSETNGPNFATASPSRTGNYVPFEGNGDGSFEIVSYEWTDVGVDLRIRVDVEHGEFGFGVFAFTNETRHSYDPVDMRAFTVTAGTPYEADVSFVMPRADSTIVLTTPSGRIALNALPIKG